MSSGFQLKDQVIDALEDVEFKGGKSLMDAKMIDDVQISNGEVSVVVIFDDEAPKELRWDIEDRVADAVENIDGVQEVNVMAVTRSGLENKSSDAAPSKLPAVGPAPQQPQPQSQPLEGVGKVIAVASGKGGVGKSTVAVNLALALKRLGHKVGLLDVDIYGPSLPTMLGINGRPNVRERRIMPLEAQGLKLMSLGFLMDEDTPVIWRGPIVSGIIRQFLQDVDWNGTDYLIVDLPPGTGDAQLSLAQSVPLDGAVVVTTPSDLALIDAARGLQMFKTLKVEVLGIIENMAHYSWPGGPMVSKAIEELEATNASPKAVATLKEALSEHGKIHIFGKGGGRREAKRLGTPFLGEIPLDADVRAGGDEGEPIMLRDPEGAIGTAFMGLAKGLAEDKPAAEDGSQKKEKRRGLFSFLRS
jgi:ATP-binding protein involved in chromosome partitioning